MAISMKYFITLILLFATQTCIFGQQRPNIVFIMSDDHAYQAISAYGFGLNNTPHIDKLATQGILFRNAFVTNSLCAPARAAVLTGKYSHLNGIKGNGDEKFDGSQETFPKQLQQAGYQTALIGKWHLESNPTGFDYWNIIPGQGDYYNPDFIENGVRARVQGYVTDLTTDFALKWLDKRDTSRPFCVLIWNKAPHRNWMPPLKYLNQYKGVQIPAPVTLFDDYKTRSKAAYEQKMEISKWLTPNYDLKENFHVDSPYQRLDQGWKGIFGRLSADEKKVFEDAYMPENEIFRISGLSGKELTMWKYQRYMKDYLSCIQSVDDNVGRLSAYLEEHGLSKNTIVVYASDQGFYLGEHGWFDKRFMYEESFKTPLIIRWPAAIRPGSVDSNLVMNIDIGTTFLAAAKADIPASFQGENMLPILLGKKAKQWRNAVYYHYYESGDEHNVPKHVGVRNDRYKLIWFYENQEWELYDLLMDKNELNNLYGKESYRNIQGQLKKQLIELAGKYKDQEILALSNSKIIN
jgi:arylsulfatase A-like enzyme